MRGGRGRGRFSGRGNSTQDIIRDNLEDLGIDAFQRIEETIPPLYPPLPIPPPSQSSAEDVYQIRKLREMTHRFQSSCYHLTRKQQTNDIARYSDKYKTTVEDTLLDLLKANTSGVESSVPFELLKGSLPGNTDGTSKKGMDILKRLEQAESNGTKVKDKKNDDESSNGEENNDEEEDEFELDDDYGVDHYASDDGGDEGGGEDEAFF